MTLPYVAKKSKKGNSSFLSIGGFIRVLHHSVLSWKTKYRNKRRVGWPARLRGRRRIVSWWVYRGRSLCRVTKNDGCHKKRSVSFVRYYSLRFIILTMKRRYENWASQKNVRYMTSLRLNSDVQFWLQRNHGVSQRQLVSIFPGMVPVRDTLNFKLCLNKRTNKKVLRIWAETASEPVNLPEASRNIHSRYTIVVLTIWAGSLLCWSVMVGMFLDVERVFYSEDFLESSGKRLNFFRFKIGIIPVPHLPHSWESAIL